MILLYNFISIPFVLGFSTVYEDSIFHLIRFFMNSRYTSIGGQDNTLPNPLLESTDRFGRATFLPAYMLKEIKHERKGRNT